MVNIKVCQLQGFLELTQVTLDGARTMFVGSNSLKETTKYTWDGYHYSKIIYNSQDIPDDMANIRFLFSKVEEGKFDAYSDTEYLTKETYGEYLKSTKEHSFNKHA